MSINRQFRCRWLTDRQQSFSPARNVLSEQQFHRMRQICRMHTMGMNIRRATQGPAQGVSSWKHFFHPRVGGPLACRSPASIRSPSSNLPTVSHHSPLTTRVRRRYVSGKALAAGRKGRGACPSMGSRLTSPGKAKCCGPCPLCSDASLGGVPES